MDRLTFTAQLVGALAWPLTVLVCVLLLRGYVTALVPLLRKLKYSDLELQFGREVAELKGAADAASLPVQKQPSEQRDADTWQGLVRLAAARPRSAIRGAWQEVEAALKRTATGAGGQHLTRVGSGLRRPCPPVCSVASPTGQGGDRVTTADDANDQMRLTKSALPDGRGPRADLGGGRTRVGQGRW